MHGGQLLDQLETNQEALLEDVLEQENRTGYLWSANALLAQMTRRLQFPRGPVLLGQQLLQLRHVQNGLNDQVMTILTDNRCNVVSDQMRAALEKLHFAKLEEEALLSKAIETLNGQIHPEIKAT